MRAQFFLPLLALVACLAVADVHFVNPPAFVATDDFSTNIVMVEGEYEDIQWADVTNPNNSRISVTMWQLNGTEFFGAPEYVIRNASSDALSTPWIVNTQKNLTLSPMFYLNLFLEGELTALVNSHYFNITAKSTTSTTSSSTTSPTPSSATSSNTASASQTSTPASSGLSAGAKAGIAIGVAGAMFLGVLAGWLILGRRAKMNNVQTSYYEPVKVDYQLQEYPQEVNAEPVARYELPPGERPQH